MGRELKRVALDFSWPINEIWEGFVNHHYDQSYKCTTCDGSGATPEMKRLSDMWYGYVPFKPEDRGSVPLCWNTPSVYAFAARNVGNSPEYYLNNGLRTLSRDEGIEREGRRLADMWRFYF